MRTRLIALVAAPLLLSSCLDSTEPQLQKLGLINTRSLRDGSVEKLRVDAVFYEAFNLQVSIGTTETCRVLPFSPEGSAGSARTIDAGAFIEGSVSGSSLPINRVLAGANYSYQLPQGSAFDYTPGDTLLVTGAGQDGGFPAFEIRVRTAEPFVLNPVGTSEPAQPLPISWSPAPTFGSRMTLSLRYASSVDSPTANAQIYCVFNDDGSASVNGSLAELWSSSPEPTRSVQAQRVRETLEVLGQNVRAQVFSFYTVPTPQLINP